jgi:hypothetical protein
MKTYLILLIIATSYNLFSQEIVKKKEFVKYEGGTYHPRHKKIYHVLTSDRDIKQGSFIIKAGKKRLVEGWYNNNEKDSLWVYNERGKTSDIRAKGYYKNDKKVGIWKYYNKGMLEQSYDYSSDSIIFTTADIKDTTLPVKKGSSFIYMKVDTPPVFKEGKSAINYYLRFADFYFGYNLPKNKAIKSKIQFEIDTNGMASNYTIIGGNYSEYNAHVLERVKKIPNEWIPAKIDNHAVTCKWTIEMEATYIMK